LGASPLLLANAEFGRRAFTLGFGAAFALAAMPVRAAGALRTFHDVRTYGAKGDGKAIDSGAINRAIEAATKRGRRHRRRAARPLSVLLDPAQGQCHARALGGRGDRSPPTR
jgi:hypothetical protein